MLIDTHAHINAPEFEGDLGEVLARAAEAGVGCLICVGYDIPSTERAIALADTDPSVFAAAGMHPNSVADAPSGWRQRIAALARHPRVVAVGESGLDYCRDWTSPGAQVEALQWHLGLAGDLGLPIIIHNRDADRDLLDALLPWQRTRTTTGSPGVLHSFAGSMDMMLTCAEAGFGISFSGMLTFRNKTLEYLGEIAVAAPEDALLIETDCPYLAPEPHRGRRNEPSFVRATAERLASLRRREVEHIERVTTTNARRIFARMSPTDA